jgi:hypothetical protein
MQIMGCFKRFRLRRTRTVLACALGLSLTDLATAQEGGIEVFAAETLFATGTRVSISHIFNRKGKLLQGSDSVPNTFDLRRDEHRIVAAVDHGIRPDLTLSALFPFVKKELESNAGDLSGSGFGDLALLAKYRAYKRDWPRGAFHLSTIGGVEIPTGETDVRDAGSRLPPQLQPGLGSWNPFLGLSANLNLNRYRFDALALYKLNTEGAQDFEKGDFVSLQAGAAYRFYQAKYPGPSASAKLGLQWRHEGQSKQAGLTLADSGSEELLLNAGLGWHPAPNIDFSLAIDLPLYEDLEGTQLGLDYRTFLALGIRF